MFVLASLQEWTTVPLSCLRMEAKQEHSDIPDDLGEEGMAERVDMIARHTFIKESQPQAMTGLSCHQPSQPSQQDHGPNHPHPTQGQG